MAKFREIKTSFLGGEISPAAMGRVDLPFYKSSCKTMKNAIPLLSGGCYRRPGTFFESSESASTDYAPRLIPFLVSKTESYALRITKVIASTGLIEAFQPTSNVAASTKTTVTGTHPWVGSLANNYTTVGFYDEWHSVQYAQSADVMILVHPRYKPYRLSRTAVGAFNIYGFDTDSAGTQLTGSFFRDSYPYLNQNTTATTLGIASTSGSNIALTASTAIFTAADDWVGVVFKINDGTNTGVVKVVSWTSTTVVRVDIISNFNNTTPSASWWESAWSNRQGWPRSVGYFQGRRVYGGTLRKPDSLFFSQTSTYTTMSVLAITISDAAGDGVTTGPTGAQPFTATLSSQQLNQIQWISPEVTLVVGTSGDEWIIDKFDQTAVFGANNIDARVTTHYGSTYLQPQRAGDELMFATFGDKDLRGFIFNFQQNNYNDEPVQLLFDEFPYAEGAGSAFGNRKFKTIAWDGTRKTLWCVDTTGHLVGLTRDRILQVTAWHSHQFGGYDATKTGGSVTDTGSAALDVIYGLCAGSVSSVAVVPNPIIGLNDVWISIKRYVNGAYVYHTERMIGGVFPYETAFTQLSGPGIYNSDASGYEANVVAFPTIVNGLVNNMLAHLEGAAVVGTVSNARGVFHVSGSAVSSADTTIVGYTAVGLNDVNSSVSMGLTFSTIIEPVRIEAGSQIGVSQGARKRAHLYTLRFYKTLACKVGRDADNLTALEFRDGDTLMGYSAELFSGDKQHSPEMAYDTDGLLYILQDKALPFALVALIAEGLEYD